MAMQSLYDVLKEKEVQLQELQRLLNEAQSVLNRVLELNAAVHGSGRATRSDVTATNGSREGQETHGSHWGANPSTEFP